MMTLRMKSKKKFKSQSHLPLSFRSSRCLHKWIKTSSNRNKYLRYNNLSRSNRVVKRIKRWTALQLSQALIPCRISIDIGSLFQPRTTASTETKSKSYLPAPMAIALISQRLGRSAIYNLAILYPKGSSMCSCKSSNSTTFLRGSLLRWKEQSHISTKPRSWLNRNPYANPTYKAVHCSMHLEKLKNHCSNRSNSPRLTKPETHHSFKTFKRTSTLRLKC